jgi:hypothetical protein
MKFEEVLPALREGKRIWRPCFGPTPGWNKEFFYRDKVELIAPQIWKCIMADDWEIVGEEHKRCPFCGGKPDLIGAGVRGWVICTKCRTETQIYDTHSEAWAAWDKRV